jgi:CheY-like chemotaxis protein
MSPATLNKIRLAFLASILVLIGVGFTLHLNLEKLAGLALLILAAWHVSRGLLARRHEDAAFRQARETADLAGRKSAELLANLSRELRTPLHGLLVMIDLLLQDEVKPSRRRRLQIAQQCADRLVALVENLLNGTGTPARRAEALSRRVDGSVTGPSVTQRPLQILLAEDDPINQEVARDILEGAGHRVQVVSNGRDAVAACDRAAFDLVLMDVQMPEMDGLQATAAIRSREREAGPHTFIAALSAWTGPGATAECLRAGMNVTLTKPLRPEQLYQLIAEVAATSASAGDQRPAIDNEAALVRDLPGILAQLVQLLETEGPTQVEEIAAGVAARDAQRVRRAAHKLAGALGTFRAQPAVTTAQCLEEMGRHGDLEEAPEAVEKLRAEVDRLLVALRTLVAHQDNSSSRQVNAPSA